MLKKIISLSLAVFLWSVVILTPKSYALVVLDQSFTETGTSGLGWVINAAFPYIAQTFTAGVTGQLAGINVNVDGGPINPPFHNLNLSIHDVQQGLPTFNILGDTTLNTNLAPLSLFVSFNENIPIVSGKQYAIVASYPDAPASPMGDGVWEGVVDVDYSAGGIYYSDGLTWNRYTDRGDLHFRTFVDTSSSAVPEPATVLLLSSGLLGMFFRRKFLAA
ncbi:MAG: PEP-CTERM sorting domain-containing protein [Candidatus Omnitrophica bacterium]|nr:PEP-CTERM sorting domain-containing protein [Candidatus Omnitrophota bacterium]